MAARKGIGRRKLLGDGAKKAVALGLATAAVGGGAAGIRAWRKRSAKVQAERRAEISKTIAESGLAINASAWIPFFEIYKKLDPKRSETKSFVLAVDQFCKTKEISLGRFFYTMEKHPLTTARIQELENRKSHYRDNPVEVARLTRIQDLIELCLRHKSLAKNLQKTRGSLRKVEGLMD